MLKGISTLAVVLASVSSMAYADTDTTTTTTNHRHHHRYHTHKQADTNYKGEAPVAYKEAAVVAPVNYFPPSWYLGASAGSRVNYASTPSIYTGLEGIIFGGYGGVIDDRFYLAGELGIGDSISLSNYRNLSGSVRSTWNAILSILPGYQMTEDSLIYLRVGAGTTKFSTPNSWSTTGVLGLGLQVAVCQNWDVRGEYVYGFYRNMSVGTPRSQQFNLGAIYKFL